MLQEVMFMFPFIYFVAIYVFRLKFYPQKPNTSNSYSVQWLFQHLRRSLCDEQIQLKEINYIPLKNISVSFLEYFCFLVTSHSFNVFYLFREKEREQGRVGVPALAQSAEHLALDFGSGHDPRVMGSSPKVSSSLSM